MSKLWKICVIVNTILIVFLLCLFITRKKESKPPVEEIVKIDSIVEHNHNIQVTIKNLENEKKDKINKVRSLDNDSTVKLFYELLYK